MYFSAMPAIDSKYLWLCVFSPEELIKARLAGYTADNIDYRQNPSRPGLDNYADEIAYNNVEDWRVRVYMVLFCVIYENFIKIPDPMRALEELMLEFHGQAIIDLDGRRLATLYAGVVSECELGLTEKMSLKEPLKPHYDKAILLLGSFKNT